MEIFVAILIIALIGAIVFAVMQRRPGSVGLPGRARSSPVGRRGGAPPTGPMAAAAAEHAQVTEPAEIPAAEARLRAQARQVAAGMNAEAASVADRRYNGELADDSVDPRRR